MDEVLGIVRHNNVEMEGLLGALMLFKQQHALVDPVEAVGLRRGSIVRADRQMNMRETGFQIANRIEGRVVVGIRANEEVIVLVIDGGAIVLHHPGDHTVLVPERDEDRNRFLAKLWASGYGARAEALPHLTAEPGPKAHGVQSQIVQATEKDNYCQGLVARKFAQIIADMPYPTTTGIVSFGP